MIVFALADGVGTSMGARFASWTIAVKFCDFVIEVVLADERFDESLLLEAVRATQSWLDNFLDDLLSRPASREFAEIRMGMPDQTARILLKNTQSPTKNYPVALSSTLLGGIIRPSKRRGTYEGYVLRIGDGVVEHIDASRSVIPVLDMDSANTTISAAIGPGPRSKAALSEGAIVKPIVLEEGECLLVCSDGLKRGHDFPVWTKLSTLVSRDLSKELDSDTAARRVLQIVAEKANESVKRDPRSKLFNDNLSLIVIMAGADPSAQN